MPRYKSSSSSRQRTPRVSVGYRAGQFYAAIYGERFTSATSAGLSKVLPLLLHKAGVPRKLWPVVLPAARRALADANRGSRSRRKPVKTAKPARRSTRRKPAKSVADAFDFSKKMSPTKLRKIAAIKARKLSGYQESKQILEVIRGQR